MSGTKFKVKQYTTDTDTDGNSYEFGAEINQDFPIEAPQGSAGKLVVNNDLEVNNNFDAGSAGITGALTAGSAGITGSLTAGSAGITGSLTAGSAGITGALQVDEINTSGLVVTGLDAAASEAVEVKIVDKSNASTNLALLEQSPSGNTYGLNIKFNGEGADEVASDSWALQSKDGNSTYNVLTTQDNAFATVLQGQSNVLIGIDGPGDTQGKFSILKGADLDPSAIDYTAGGATELLKLDTSGELTLLEDGIKITGSIKSTNTSTSIQIGEDTQNTIALNAVNINIGSNITDVINVASDEVRLSSPIVPMVNNEVEVKSFTNVGDPIGLTVSKPSNGSAYLKIAETSAGTSYGGQLVYEGDSSEDMGVSDSTIALQGLDSTGVHTVLSYKRSGKAVNLQSEDYIKIDANGAASSANYVQITGYNLLSNQTYFLARSATGTTLMLLGNTVSTTGSWSPFTGSHVYYSDSELTVGSAVNLVGSLLEVCSSPLSKLCAGIISHKIDIVEESQDSLLTTYTDATPGAYLYVVHSVGDTRTSNCQGFNVCNENGDIQPGDLLVTSSTPGYLMKQDDDIIRSSTVGKAMESVVFNEQGQATGVYGYLYCG